MDRLLVIDDEPELGRFVGRVAESVGYEVKVTTQVREFKNLISHWEPGVIILDLIMPEVDGIELLNWLASQNCRARIIIMSGFDLRVVEAAKQIGRIRGLNVDFVFIKPIRVQDLKERLISLKPLKPEHVTEADLESCLAERELFLLYQPKVSLETGETQGFEALVRWRHPTRGTIFPDQFIKLAEKTGLIDKLTNFVLAEALFQQKFMAQQGLDVEMAINLSPTIFHNERLVDQIVMLCNAENIPMNRIVFEVTESAVMDNDLGSLDMLTRLRLKGFKLSIDDFGTGESSLVRLRHLPVTEVKIDRSFVNDMLTSQDAFLIVKAVIALAHDMGLTVVAEGVRSGEHYRLLTELGCDLAQGDEIAKPLLANEIPSWNAGWKMSSHAVSVML